MRMMKKISILAVALSFALICTEAYAKKKKKRKKRKKKKMEDNPAAQVHSYPYGMAGCGLGSLVLKEDTMMMQVFAATLNGTGVQTFGITTGTSNCKVQKADLAEMEQKVFVEANLASLTKEAAQGEGHSLRAFAEVLGCSDQFAAFAKMGQDRYDSLFSSGEPETVLLNYRNAVTSNTELSSSCDRART